MKSIRIVLMVLTVLVIGSLVAYVLWPETPAPAVVEEAPTLPIEVPTVAADGMEYWDWVNSDVSEQGTQFMYPNPLPTVYISAEAWPPEVSLTADLFSCIEGEITDADGVPQTVTAESIDGQLYCVSVANEGAAGSTYTSYIYVTQQGDFIAHISFTLRTVQCMNYDEPERAACITEQESFSSDALASRIAASIRMR